MSSIAELHAKYVDKYGEDEAPPRSYLSSGSSFLDSALGGKGYPMGRIVELFGPEGSGKTTFGLSAIASARKSKIPAAIVDAECALDLDYAKAVGAGRANVDYVHLVPDVGEQAVEMIRDLLDDKVRVVVVDSVAALTPRAEFEGDPGEAFMGLQARMMGQALRMLVTRVHQNGGLLIFINQVRSKIGVFFGSPNVTSGGRALPFYATQRVEIRTGEKLERGSGTNKQIIGHLAKVKVVKNKVAVPFRTADVPIVFGLGIHTPTEIFYELGAKGLLKTKSSYYVAREHTFAGKHALIDDIEQNEKEYRRILREHQKATQSASR